MPAPNDFYGTLPCKLEFGKEFEPKREDKDFRLKRNDEGKKFLVKHMTVKNMPEPQPMSYLTKKRYNEVVEAYNFKQEIFRCATLIVALIV